ncbi:MAG TPA: M48 family metalloprotease [Candidatus Xenobia bacterium]|jgi:predicted Zn-dependent protease
MRLWVLLLLLWVPCFAWADDATELDLGHQMAPLFEKDKTISRDLRVLAPLQAMVDRMAPATGRALPYRIEGIVQSEQVNAMTLPGGHIYVYQGLLDMGLSRDQMAGVLGHEMAHAALSHGYKRLREASAARRLGHRLHGFNTLNALLLDGVGRRYEYQADAYGTRYATAAGYDPAGLLEALQRIQHLETVRPGVMARLLATHPPTAERIDRLKTQLKSR